MYPEIIQWSTNIRNQQNWVSPAEKVDLDDFEGDEQAFQEYKLAHGGDVRKLSQDEKNLMFGLFEQKLEDGMYELSEKVYELTGKMVSSQKKRRQGLYKNKKAGKLAIGGLDPKATASSFQSKK